jgi:hypothetical protein
LASLSPASPAVNRYRSSPDTDSTT